MQYERIREFEERLPENRRFHKGTPLHNWGISILLQQQSNRIEEGFNRILLAYVEDLLDVADFDRVRALPAYIVLSGNPFLTIDFLNSVREAAQERLHNGNIPKNPEDVISVTIRNAFHTNLQQFITNRLRIVFVVHGRNISALDSIRAFLTSLGLTPIILADALPHLGQGTPYIGELLDRAFSIAHAVIVLMTPDDKGFLKNRFRRHNDQSWETKPTGQARLNVIYEAGLAMGGVFRNQTILVELGDLRPFSDIGGRFIMRLDNSRGSRQNLISRLQAIGCAVRITNNEWETTGDFEGVLLEEQGILHRLKQLIQKS